MNMVLKRAHEISEELIYTRRHLHQHAEAGLELPVTTKFVMEKLKEYGYAPNEICESGILATVGGHKGGKVLLLRADMDGLNMVEESNLPFSSKTNCAHACGHDIHTTMLLGAAKILKEMEHELNGTVKIMFQPAEEIFLGSKKMIEAGILENPKVDAAFGIHVANDHPVNYFGFNKNAGMASSDNFEITIKGKGCHGAMPYLGTDPINVGAHIHTALQTILAREVNSNESAVITIGQFIAGDSVNVIPEKAILRGTMRAFSKETRDLMFKRMNEIVTHISKAFNTEVTINELASVPTLINDERMVDLFLDTVKQLDIENLDLGERKSIGSEDFAFISNLVPSAFVFIGAALADKSKRFPGHNPKIVFDENCIPIGVATHVLYALNWLNANS